MTILEKIEGLKPCPFCAGTDIEIMTKEFCEKVKNNQSQPGIAFEIKCHDCDTCMHDYYFTDNYEYSEIREKLVKRWNTRRRVKK